MTNTDCKYYRTSECPEEDQPLVICDLCKKCDIQTDQERFESFCKKNDLDYDFSFLAGKGKFYRSSETNKAFCIFKWAPGVRK